MTVSYELSGLDISRLVAQFTARAKEACVQHITDEMIQLGEELRDRMRQTLMESFTRTGLERVASGAGQQAGRYDEGDMHDLIDYTLDLEYDTEELVLRWGWIDEVREYFAYQEYGTGNIEPMGALQESFSYGMVRVAEILREAGR